MPLVMYHFTVMPITVSCPCDAGDALPNGSIVEQIAGGNHQQLLDSIQPTCLCLNTVVCVGMGQTQPLKTKKYQSIF